MNHEEVGKYWDGNAETWTKLARAGYDVYRDYVNTPGFFRMLPDVTGLDGLDIGCGEGHNTRLLAKRGARMAAVDISGNFIREAKVEEERVPQGIDSRVAGAAALRFPDSSFDFAAAFMSFMDMPETDKVLGEAHRVLRQGGFLQFSITHPSFDTPHRRNLRNEKGITYAIEVGDYFRNLEGDVAVWSFSAAPAELRQGLPKLKTPRFTRTISQWFNMLIDAGFAIERVGEPRPDDAAVKECPFVQDAQVVAYFLHVRARKSKIGGEWD